MLMHINDPKIIPQVDTSVTTAATGVVVGSAMLLIYPVLRFVEWATNQRLQIFLNKEEQQDENNIVKKLRRLTRYNRRYLRHPERFCKSF